MCVALVAVRACEGCGSFFLKKLFPTGVWVVLSVVAGFSLRGSVVVTGRCVCLARVALLAGATSGQVCGMTVPLSLMVRGGRVSAGDQLSCLLCFALVIGNRCASALHVLPCVMSVGHGALLPGPL